MMYCFDTNVFGAALKRDPPMGLIRRIAAVPPAQQFTTSITLAELLYGAMRRSQKLLEKVRRIMAAQTVLPFDDPAAERYAELRVALEKTGRPIDHPDLQIAAIALSRNLTLVTGNVRHFARVPGLTVENWLTD